MSGEDVAVLAAMLADAGRRAQGIDGTAGDAQDARHQYVPDKPHTWCLLCGLSPTYRKHVGRLLDCGLCYEENGEEVHPHPECTTPTPAQTPEG